MNYRIVFLLIFSYCSAQWLLLDSLSYFYPHDTTYLQTHHQVIVEEDTMVYRQSTVMVRYWDVGAWWCQYCLGQIGKPHMLFWNGIPFSRLIQQGFFYPLQRRPSLYMVTPYDVPIIQGEKPLSDVYFVQNSRKTQLLHIRYAQQIDTMAGFSTYYQRLTAQGAYLNFSTDHLGMGARLWFAPFKQRLLIQGTWVFNQRTDNIHGGVQDTIEEVMFSKLGAPIRLLNTKDLRKWHLWQFSLAWRLSKITLGATFQQSWYQRIYEDPAPLYPDTTEAFPYKGLQDTLTYLSASLDQQSLQPSLWLRIHTNTLQLKGKVFYELQQYRFLKQDSNTIKGAHFSLQWRLTTIKILYDVRWQQWQLFSGKSEWQHYLQLQYWLQKRWKLQLQALYSQRTPYLYTLWQIPFEVPISTWQQSQSISVDGHYQSKNFYLRLGGYYTVLDSFSFYGVRLGYHFAWRFLHWQGIVWKTFPFSPLLPSWQGRSTFYFETPIAKKQHLFQSGITFWIYGTTYLKAYHPVLGIWYDTRQQQFPYIRLDAYASLVLYRRVSVFIRLIHWNEALGRRKGVFLSAYYPLLERSFSFGVRWLVLE